MNEKNKNESNQYQYFCLIKLNRRSKNQRIFKANAFNYDTIEQSGSFVDWYLIYSKITLLNFNVPLKKFMMKEKEKVLLLIILM